MDPKTDEQKRIAVFVNGKTRSLQVGATVADLLASLNLVVAQVVVEYNGQPLERESIAATHAREGDRIEIAQMVGGG